MERGTWPADRPVGQHPSVTEALPRLLAELLRLGLLATFFIEAINCELNPKAVRAIAEHGHEIGIHGWRHESWDGHRARARASAPEAIPRGLPADRRRCPHVPSAGRGDQRRYSRPAERDRLPLGLAVRRISARRRRRLWLGAVRLGPRRRLPPDAPLRARCASAAVTPQPRCRPLRPPDAYARSWSAARGCERSPCIRSCSLTTTGGRRPGSCCSMLAERRDQGQLALATGGELTERLAAQR